MESVVLFVPYIASSSNTRQHWTARKREVDACHLIVRDAVRRAGLCRIEQPVDLAFTPRLGKGVRRRDTSNYSYSLKQLEDGLVAAGVLPDDRGEYVRRVVMEPPVVDRKAETGTWIEICEAQRDAAPLRAGDRPLASLES
ncbi:hypothetical protein [Salinicola halophilus]|uniref:hypothetical protein n=1 Tax=Salinicola halophilus TaxID=184065 RepID=UPI000DA15761|nr:hypothetical protein [Salinicola halophilus]